MRLTLILFLLSPFLAKSSNIDTTHVQPEHLTSDISTIEYWFSLINTTLCADTIIYYGNLILDEQKRDEIYETYIQTASVVEKELQKRYDYHKITNVLEEVRNFALHKDDSIQIAKTDFRIGINYRNLNKSSKVIPYLEEALAYSEQLRDTSLYLKVCSQLGLAYIKMERDDKVMELYLKGLKIAEKTNNKRSLTSINGHMGLLYFFNDDLIKAKKYYQVSLKYAEEINDSILIALQRNHIGQVTAMMGEVENAILLFKDNVKFCEVLKKKSSLATAYEDLAEGLKLEDKVKWKEVEDLLNKSFAIYTDLNDVRGKAGVLTKLGGMWRRRGDFGRAIIDLKKAEEIIEETDNMEYLRYLYDNIANYYHKKGDYKNSFKYLMKAYVAKDTLISKNQTTLLAQMESKYKFKQQQDSIQLLKTNELLKDEVILRQRFISSGAIIFFILAGIIATLLFYQSQNRKKNNQQLSQKNQKIATLHQELRHRTGNNLSFISSMMRLQIRGLQNQEAKQAVKEGESRVAAMSLLHRKLHHSEEDSNIDIAEYLIEICQHLQSTFPYSGKPPQIDIQIPNLKLDAEQAVKIGLLVNEWVTNSFKHAFHQQEEPRIDIQFAEIEPSTFRLTYQDNGSGLPGQATIQSKKTLGMRLIRELTNQLDGQLSVENPTGIFYQLDFQTAIITV